MKSFLIGVALGLVCVGCAARPPVETQFDDSVSVDAPFDSVWTAVIETFADHSWPIATLEKVSGLVATDWMVPEPNMGDCGTTSLGQRRRPNRGKFNVFVKAENAKTSVRVTCAFEDFVSAMGFSQTLPCVSSGVVEAMVLDDLRKRLGLSGAPNTK